MSTTEQLIKFSALTDSIAALDVAKTQAETAAAAAAFTSLADPNYVSLVVGVKPIFGAAPADTIGGYFKTSGEFQLLSWDTFIDTEVGIPLMTETNMQARNKALFVSTHDSTALYTEIQAAHDALPASGGTILVDALEAGDSDYAAFTVTTDNVNIIGLFPAEIDFTLGLFDQAGVRVEGTSQINGNNCQMSGVSIHTTNTAADCLTLGGTKDNCTLTNLRLLGKLSSSAFHCLLIDGMTNVKVSNIKTYRNIWGIAVKDSYVNVEGCYGETHDSGPVLVKAEGGDTIRSINVSNCVYKGAGASNYYVQAVASSTLYDVNMTNLIAYQGGFLYNLEALSTIEGVTFKGCKSRDATTNSWQFFGTSTSAIDLIGCSGLGAATNSVYMDDSTGHTNISYESCNFDNPVQGFKNNTRSGIGGGVSKSGVAENTATDILKIEYEGIDSTAYLVSLISNSASTQSSSIFLITTASTSFNSVKLEESASGIDIITLTPSIDTGTNEVTINVTIDQTSTTEAMTVECQITPIGARQQFLITPL